MTDREEHRQKLSTRTGSLRQAPSACRCSPVRDSTMHTSYFTESVARIGQFFNAVRKTGPYFTRSACHIRASLSSVHTYAGPRIVRLSTPGPSQGIKGSAFSNSTFERLYLARLGRSTRSHGSLCCADDSLDGVAWHGTQLCADRGSVRRKIGMRKRAVGAARVPIQMLMVVREKLSVGRLRGNREIFLHELVLLHQSATDDLIVRVQT